MATKDLEKVPHSVFVVAMAAVVLVALAVLIVVSSSSPTSTQDVQRQRAVDQAEDEAGTLRTTGVVTEVFRDCAEKLELVDGEVVQSDDPISCDGGSYFTVNETTLIYNASGFVAIEDAYSYDIGSLQPGDNIEAVYVKDEFGLNTLNCDACSITIL